MGPPSNWPRQASRLVPVRALSLPGICVISPGLSLGPHLFTSGRLAILSG